MIDPCPLLGGQVYRLAVYVRFAERRGGADEQIEVSLDRLGVDR